MSMFGIDLGGFLSPFGMEPLKPPQPVRPAPPPPLPSFLLQPQAPPKPQAAPQPPRQTPPPTATTMPQKPRNGTQHAERAAARAGSGKHAEAAQESRSGDAMTSVLPVLHRESDDGHGEGDEHEEQESGGAEARDARATNGDLDCALLADELTAQAGEEGIFEVEMPGGKTLGVVVRLDNKRAQFLLSPSDETLAKHLKQGKMELEGLLGRRMNKEVDISVL